MKIGALDETELKFMDFNFFFFFIIIFTLLLEFAARVCLDPPRMPIVVMILIE
jgi:hypothetical protein